VRTAAAAHLARLRPTARWPLAYAAASAVFFLIVLGHRQALGAGDVLLLLALCAPLAWQRDRPLGAAVVTLACLCLATGLGIEAAGDTSATFALIVGPVFCAARFAHRRTALACLAAYFVVLPLNELLRPHPDPGVFAAFVFFVAPTWLIGRLVRSRSALVRELASVNAALDAEQAARAEAAAAQERAQVARELHDIVAHALSVMVLQAAGARLAVVRAPEASIAALRVVEQAGRDAEAEMGRLLGVLRGDGDAPPAGLARLGELAARARLAGLALELSVDGPAHALAPTVDLAAFRIAQEAVTNAVKHAAPTNARLQVSVSGDALHVIVEDDGHPDGPRQGEGTGHGLLGMRERAELHGGVVEAARRAGGGFRVHARLPVS
jgi:signal transduction histidine kinase